MFPFMLFMAPSFVPVSPIPGLAGTHSSSDEQYNSASSGASTTLTVRTDGTVTVQGNGNISAPNLSTHWGQPAPFSGIGSGYWVRFTLTTTSGSADNTSWTTTTGWLQLNANRVADVTATAPNPSTSPRNRSATYTVEIATDSAGSNIVSTTANVTLSANARSLSGPPP